MRQMVVRLVLAALVACGWIGATPTFGQEQTELTELQLLKQQVEELQNRIQQLEEREAKAEEAAAKKPEAVLVATKGSKIKVDGRMFVGVFDTEDDASFPKRSLDIPDAKLRFTFSPQRDLVFVNRFNTSRAATSGFDYFYVDMNNIAGRTGHTLRAGKLKIDVGEETWTDNPVESILISNSVPVISGYDEGINLRGPLGEGGQPATYSVYLLNGTKDFTASNSDLTWGAKIGGAPNDNLYLSLSYISTGDLVSSDGSPSKSDLRIAGLQEAPAGATSWSRSLWEVDARWNYGTTGIRPTIVSEPSSGFQAALAYGQFTDDASPVPDRDGDYWYVEGLYNLTDRLFVASRLSQISLDNDVTAALGNSPVAVNEYTRLSLGLGCRLGSLTQAKLEWTRNDTDGGASEPDLDQLAVGIATKF